MATVLITGGTGFLGSALTRHWIGAGHAVHILTRRSSSLDKISTVLDRVQSHTFDSLETVPHLVSAISPD